MILHTLKLTNCPTVSKAGFSNVELGDDLKLSNLAGRFRIVELSSDGYIGMRRVSELNILESGVPFRAKPENLNVDFVYA